MLVFAKEEVKDTAKSRSALANLLTKKSPRSQDASTPGGSKLSHSTNANAHENAQVSFGGRSFSLGLASAISSSSTPEGPSLAVKDADGFPFTCKCFVGASKPVIVSITEHCSITRLRDALLANLLQSTRPSAVASLSSRVQLVVATMNGEADEDCPELDVRRSVHQFGIHSFLLCRRQFVPDSPDSTSDRNTLDNVAEEEEEDEGAVLASLRPEHYAIRIGPQSSQPAGDPMARLFHGAETGSILDVSKVLSHGFVDINAKATNEWTALHMAARQGHVPMAAYLLKNNADIDAQTKKGWTPLHLACFQGHIEVAEILLACGADAELKDAVKKTAMDHAVQQGRTQVISVLNDFT